MKIPWFLISVSNFRYRISTTFFSPKFLCDFLNFQKTQAIGAIHSMHFTAADRSRYCRGLIGCRTNKGTIHAFYAQNQHAHRSRYLPGPTLTKIWSRTPPFLGAYSKGRQKPATLRKFLPMCLSNLFWDAQFLKLNPMRVLGDIYDLFFPLFTWMRIILWRKIMRHFDNFSLQIKLHFSLIWPVWKNEDF